MASLPLGDWVPTDLAGIPRLLGYVQVGAGTWLEAYAATNQGAAVLQQGRTGEAEDLYRRALALFSAAGDPWGRGAVLRALAVLSAERGAEARAQYAAAADTFREPNNVLMSSQVIRWARARRAQARCDPGG
jgi:hypothetical protein